MILFDWLLRNIDHTDADNGADERVAQAINDKARQIIELEKEVLPTQRWYGDSKVYFSSVYTQPKPKVEYPRHLDHATKDKIQRYGMYWKEKNLKILGQGIYGSVLPNSIYQITLVTSTGNDILIPKQDWCIESNNTLPINLVFDIPRNTAIVGFFVYDSTGEIVTTKKFNRDAYPYESVFTLNCTVG